jgi:excisionase family DNA binding protein
MPAPRTDVDLLTPADAAHILGLSVDMVRILAAEGQLPTAIQTARGARLFRREDVEELAAARAGRPIRHHSVKLYESDDHLAAVVAGFLGNGLRSGGPALVIGTEPHRRAVVARLGSDDLPIADIVAEERLLLLDARETLDAFVVAGVVDEARFRDRIGPLLDRMRQGWPRRRTRAFGEMVDLLWRDGRRDAALELEAMWNRLAGERPFTLLCAYSMSSLASAADTEPFDRMCDAHTRVVPAEAYDQDGGIDERHREVARLQQRARVLAELLGKKPGEEP